MSKRVIKRIKLDVIVSQEIPEDLVDEIPTDIEIHEAFDSWFWDELENNGLKVECLCSHIEDVEDE